MEVHLRSPCVEDEDIANFCAEMSGVFRQFPDRCGCRMIESIIKELLITVNDRDSKDPDGKNQMEIGRIKNIFPAGIHPFFLRNCLHMDSSGYGRNYNGSGTAPQSSQILTFAPYAPVLQFIMFRAAFACSGGRGVFSRYAG